MILSCSLFPSCHAHNMYLLNLIRYDKISPDAIYLGIAK